MALCNIAERGQERKKKCMRGGGGGGVFQIHRFKHCHVFQPPGPFVLGPHPESFAGFHSQLFSMPVSLHILHPSCPEPEHSSQVDTDSLSGARLIAPSPPTCKHIPKITRDKLQLIKNNSRTLVCTLETNSPCGAHLAARLAYFTKQVACAIARLARSGFLHKRLVKLVVVTCFTLAVHLL